MEDEYIDSYDEERWRLNLTWGIVLLNLSPVLLSVILGLFGIFYSDYTGNLEYAKLGASTMFFLIGYTFTYREDEFFSIRRSRLDKLIRRSKDEPILFKKCDRRDMKELLEEGGNYMSQDFMKMLHKASKGRGLEEL